jgi:hypothetical protein
MILKTWAEIGIWNAGEPALLVMQGALEDGQPVDTPTVLHDLPLTLPEGHAERDMLTLPWQEPLAALGYRRVPGSNHEYLDYSVAFDVEVWQ